MSDRIANMERLLVLAWNKVQKEQFTSAVNAISSALTELRAVRNETTPLPAPERWEADRDGCELRVVLRWSDNAENRAKVRAVVDAVLVAGDGEDE